MAAATELGMTPKKLTDYEESWEGLGALQADMATLERKFVQKNQEAAATGAVDELDSALDDVRQRKSELDATLHPSAEDQNFAHAQAVGAVKKAIENGDLAGVKPGSAAATKGLTALTGKDFAVAKTLLGDDAVTQYQNTYQIALQASPNFKAQLQARQIAQQNFMQSQRSLATLHSDLRKASAVNPALADKLAQRRTKLQQLAEPLETPSAPVPLEQNPLLQPRQKTPGASPPTTSAAPAQPGLFSRGLGALLALGNQQARQIPGVAPLETAASATGHALGLAGNALWDQVPSATDITGLPEGVVSGLEALAARRANAATATADQEEDPEAVLAGGG